MNKDQVKGTLKSAAGKVQQATGKVVGSNEQQAKGLKKQVEGQAQKAVGDIKEVVKDATRK
ncbi:CsbD family protein [Rubrivivax rivuli]|uniref:CsbD family protein n=1 Tax=Rubrivivax rivuli TaxID=1862385 RepID=A0A437RRH5_9BURK|nr:CsbD family protein [Rubrivivax rivuli]RVU49393.1 CsbD family protein [Rubrivivax rivuli]